MDAESAKRRGIPSPFLSFGLSLTLLAGGVALYGLRWYRDSRPEAVILRTAGSYLKAVQSKDYDAAYALLSNASKEAGPIEEFKLVQNVVPWSYSDPQFVLKDGDRAAVRYQWASPNAPSQEEFLFFVWEDGRWAHPWTWNLFRQIENARSHDRPDAAYALAKTAAAASPLDPLAQSYLCEAAYDGGTPQDAVRECRSAVASAARIPSRLTPESRYRLHYLLADTLKNSLHQYAAAAAEYTQLLGYADAPARDQCDLRIARGESRVATGEYPGALQDFQASARFCTDAQDQAALSRASHVLSGDADARQEAVALVQGWRPAEGQPTLAEWGRKHSRRGARNAPAPRWSAEYLGGTQYAVTFQTADAVLLTARTDLWNDAVRDVQPTQP